jgi:peptidoglycan/xylan/chitin deacetylase (PgdA/CDA1 family)
LNIRLAATIATALVIVVGFAMISPLFFHPVVPEAKQKIMLSFSVTKPNNSVEWCKNLSTILNNYHIGATVFITGKIAEENPATVLVFSNKVDIGSRTYNNVNLNKISDYSFKFQEITQGKIAIDKAGNLNSKVFLAPDQATDQDIYSLLNRANITADFSYNDQYNLYQNNQFIKLDAKTYDAQTHPPEFFLEQSSTDQPIIIAFNDTYTTDNIVAFLDMLITGHFEFVNASELTGAILTVRGT